MAHNRISKEHMWDNMTDLELLKSANLYRKDTLTGEEGLTLAGILLLGSQQTIIAVFKKIEDYFQKLILNTDFATVFFPADC